MDFWMLIEESNVYLCLLFAVKNFLIFSPGKHTIFGRICKGMEIIKRLGSVQTDNKDRFYFLISITSKIFFIVLLFFSSFICSLCFPLSSNM